MTLSKKDFIEIEFTAKTKDGDVFDSNIKAELDKMESQQPAKPFIFCLGEGMFLQAIEKFLIGKEPGKHTIELNAENAFGKRKPEMVKLMPMKVFAEQKVNPFPGAMFNFDGQIGKVLSVSSGRVMMDFNNPIAGKDVIYEVDVKRKVEDLSEKIKSFIEFLFKRELKFETKEKKIIIHADAQMKQFVEMFAEKFKDIFGLDLEVKEEKKAEGKEKSTAKDEKKEEKEKEKE